MFNRPKTFDPNLFVRTIGSIKESAAIERSDADFEPRFPGAIPTQNSERIHETVEDRVHSQPRFVNSKFMITASQSLFASVRDQVRSMRATHVEIKGSICELRAQLDGSFEQVELSLDEMVRRSAHRKSEIARPDMRRSSRSEMKCLGLVTALRSQSLGLKELTRNSSTDFISILSECVADILNHTEKIHRHEMEVLRDKLLEETSQRRKLHNLVQELKGCVRVFARIRPLLQSEISNGARSCMSAMSDTELILTRGGCSRKFAFDRVFDQNAANGELCDEVQQLLISSLDGFNVSVLTYGITGSGKSYTIQGLFDRVGLDLFEEKASRERIDGWKYEFQLAVYEIYNETIIDLLNLRNIDTAIRLDPKTGHFHIPGITKVPLSAPTDVDKNMREATRNRSVSSTNCNEQSSRSHLITSILIQSRNPSGATKSSKVSLVDLAGSERLDRSGATGSCAKEAVHINKSLSALGDVIQARLHKASQVPYRNSMLTGSLQDCISGDSKTLILLQLSPNEDSVDETSNCLGFGTRLRELETSKSMSSPRRR